MKHQFILSAAVVGLLASSASAQFDPSDRRERRTPPEPGGQLIHAQPLPPGLSGQEGDVHFFHGQPPRLEKGAYLGVATTPPGPAMREQLKLAKGMGLVVDFVEPGSPAEAAGLKPHDVLTKLNDQLLINGQQLAVLVRSLKAEEEVELTIIRQGETTTVKAKLAEKDLPPLEEHIWSGPHGEAHPFPGGGTPLAPLTRERPRLERPVPPPHGNVVSTTVWTDGEHTLTITTGGRQRGRHLLAKDKEGNVLYDGPLDNPGDREKLPTGIADKLKRMESGARRPGPGPNGAPGRPGDAVLPGSEPGDRRPEDAPEKP